MSFDRIISCSQQKEFIPLTFHNILFSKFPHRSEDCLVIQSHIGDEIISLSLKDLRLITGLLSGRLSDEGIKCGDTIMLASFSCTNELANILVFAAAADMGVRVFIPIFPEPSEFDSWRSLTDFSCVVMPLEETRQLKDHPREKTVVEEMKAKCAAAGIRLMDPMSELGIRELLKNKTDPEIAGKLNDDVIPDSEMVIFTTSGTSGKSKLLAYSHKAFSFCCQSWQEAGLFEPELFGNCGFSPLFTHTIGIRTFINCLWSGNPFCVITTEWFLNKPQVVRYFLLNTTLGHIIGGPAFFNTMLELLREYPELKIHLQKSLKSAISIGAPFDKATAARFRTATGVTMMNGFGTTETLMVSLNRSSAADPCNLGNLLPGVTFGLRSTGEDGLYELSVKSNFQSARTIGEGKNPEYFETGDLVVSAPASEDLRFSGRRSADFIKDEYGVKIPVSALKVYYSKLYDRAKWIEWLPLTNMPGLSALVFSASGNSSSRQKELSAMLKSVNDELRQKAEPFEFDHRHLKRFTIVDDPVPLTRKGTISRDQILKKYGQLISDLRNPFVYNTSVEAIDISAQSDLYKYSNPYLSELLEALKLDRTYTGAEGDFLYCREGSSTQKVTDFTGGFGAGLLGHNHPEIRNEIIRFLQSNAPAINNQGSQYYYPSLLAKELNRIFSDKTGKYFRVLFGNSGTEATEIALHHAYFEWRRGICRLRDEQLQLYGSAGNLCVAEIWDRNMQILDGITPCVIVEKDCFHGYSSGSRSLLSRKKHKTRFEGLLRPHALHVDDSSPAWKEETQKLIEEKYTELEFVRMENGKCTSSPLKISVIIASIIEPVRGEGGIRQVNPEFADFLSEQKFPLISDEIQCGLGRTGSFPSYKKASYYLLGKSLGGGFEKISAVLIDDERFKPDFARYFNSTFANGEMAAATALSALKIIEKENIPATAHRKGEKILSILGNIACKYPGVIKSIEGSGLMIGIHFNEKLREENVILRILVDHDLLGYLLTAWLLNNHNIRVLPSLSAPLSLRLEPSYLVPDEEIERFGKALEELCMLCSEKRLYSLLKFLMNGDPYTDRQNPVFEGSFPQKEDIPLPGSVTAGFIGNFTISHRELQLIEPDLGQASDTGLRLLFDKLQVLLHGKPVRIMVKNIMQGRVHFIFYILPFDTSHLEVISRWGKKRFYIKRIQDAVDKIASAGAVCLSLGAHTSIISGNGLMLAEREGCRILTGNSLTAGSCIFHLNRYLEGAAKRRTMTIAVVGAGGNIGSGITQCLMDQCLSACKIILAGNNEKRLLKLKNEMEKKGLTVSATTDLFELKKADVIICCVNTNDPVVFRHHLNETRPVFIIDISVPHAVSEDVRQMNNVAFCNDASSVRICDAASLLISSHTPEGKFFCCAGETILYALHKPDLQLKGHIRHQSVSGLINLAVKEGFFE
ncbi:MAG TPA: aminotransferase class III-fold pyridoxal phosphate-dependent enzyme [Bacteroidales bacterium]|nr:aminotransferase class III-fold pyridoxal phosphate-dependent enzyme [Bacteroidales bacterium]